MLGAFITLKIPRGKNNQVEMIITLKISRGKNNHLKIIITLKISRGKDNQLKIIITLKISWGKNNQLKIIITLKISWGKNISYCSACLVSSNWRIEPRGKYLHPRPHPSFTDLLDLKFVSFPFFQGYLNILIPRKLFRLPPVS